jgi:hypothetical protein
MQLANKKLKATKPSFGQSSVLRNRFAQKIVPSFLSRVTACELGDVTLEPNRMFE